MQNTIAFQLAFEVQATVHQTIHLVAPGLTEEDIIAGLQNGSIITTLWHTQGEPGSPEQQLLDLRRPDAEQKIGVIISQQVDGDYSLFR